MVERSDKANASKVLVSVNVNDPTTGICKDQLLVLQVGNLIRFDSNDFETPICNYRHIGNEVHIGKHKFPVSRYWHWYVGRAVDAFWVRAEVLNGIIAEMESLRDNIRMSGQERLREKWRMRTPIRFHLQEEIENG